MSKKINLISLKEKKQKLEEIRQALKKEFFGIDEVIDRVISSINTWWLLPESLKSPVIISLWGLTGTGKTSLIRSLTSKLGFANKYCEIQMEISNSGTNYSIAPSICKMLEASNICEGEPGIILLDEMQKFRTVGNQGEDMPVEKFQDIWSLLSDGAFGLDQSYFTDLESEIIYDSYNSEQEEVENEDIPIKKKKKTKQEQKEESFYKKITPWQAKMYKKLLRLKEPLDEVMKMSKAHIIDLCKLAVENRSSTTIDYSKLLIFLAGNLDEAFNMARKTNDCDTDADLYCEVTKKITVLDIKEVLKRRFKPEQIARFGNNFIIYPSLNKKAYQSIIFNSCQKYIDFLKNNLSLDFNLNQSVYDVIYSNSVLPASGTRTVFSSIHKIFSEILPDFALWSIENKIDKANISLNKEEFKAYLIKDNKTLKELPVSLDFDEIKKDNSKAFNTMVAVHEIGHALSHALLFGFAPMEVKINVSSFKGGYTVIDEDNANSKKEFHKTVSVLMAGVAAEELIFGENNISAGCASDLYTATSWAARYFRDLGFGKQTIVISNDNPIYYNNLHSSDVEMDKFIKKCKTSVKKLLKKYLKLLISLSEELLEKECFNEQEFIDLCAKYNLKIRKSFGDTNIEYDKLFEKAKLKIA